MADRDVYSMTDEELVKGTVLVSRHPLFERLELTAWERRFLHELSDYWRRMGFIGWKQRRSARQLITKVREELERRDQVWDWAEEARSLEEVR